MGPAWWVDVVELTHPHDLGIGATLPSFVVSFALGTVVAVAGGRRV